MSKFKFVCVDEDLPFGPSKTRHEFETNDIHEIVKHFRDFLHMAGFNRINLSVDRDISFDNLDTEDLDEYTEKLFAGTPVPKE
jgi:uncharacterized protein YqgV (UPF0045/DUF77 family)